MVLNLVELEPAVNCERSRRLLWVRSRARPADDEASVTKRSGRKMTRRFIAAVGFRAPQAAASAEDAIFFY